MLLKTMLAVSLASYRIADAGLAVRDRESDVGSRDNNQHHRRRELSVGARLPQEWRPDQQANIGGTDPILTPQDVMPENFWDEADASIWKLDTNDDAKCGLKVRNCATCSGKVVTSPSPSDGKHAVGDASLALDKQGRCARVR